MTMHQAKKHELGFESLPHPPYFLDLAPSDYYLFPNFKRWLCGRHFKSNEEVEWKTEVERSLYSLYRAKRRVH